MDVYCVLYDVTLKIYYAFMHLDFGDFHKNNGQ
jgi:hypothetical protein